LDGNDRQSRSALHVIHPQFDRAAVALWFEAGHQNVASVTSPGGRSKHCIYVICKALGRRTIRIRNPDVIRARPISNVSVLFAARRKFWLAQKGKAGVNRGGFSTANTDCVKMSDKIEDNFLSIVGDIERYPRAFVRSEFHFAGRFEG